MREYARLRGVAHRAVQHHVETGTIRLVDGMVDPKQADEAWDLIRRARVEVQDDDAGRRSARAKVAVTLAKLRLAKQRFEALNESYVDRAEAIVVGRREAEHILDCLRAAPAAHAAAFAAALDIEPERARRILERFFGYAVAELGNLAAQAERDAERA